MSNPKAEKATPAPLCFVLMPFGQKPDEHGRTIDFDAVYENQIAPAIREAQLEPVRADEERVGGIIHKPMFERLILCEYAVADLTLANANVFYELGVRHAVRPHTTVLVFAADTHLPFDVALARGLSYRSVDQDDGFRNQLRQKLESARTATVDSPVYQLVEGFPDIERLKTDVFRDRIDYSARRKEELAQAREVGRRSGKKAGRQAVRAVQDDLGPLHNVEAGILIDLFLSYRAVGAFADMIDLVAELPTPLARTPLIREQLGLALNRQKHRGEAERVLQSLIDERGPSSETYGLLGRLYKDQWEEAFQAGRAREAAGLLRKAIDTYVRGFETDWRDAYPGVNAVTLMELSDQPDPRQHDLLPVVSYAVARRLASSAADYWDHATTLELAVLRRDEQAASRALDDALALVREHWEPESTAATLRRIREARERHGVPALWAREIEDELLAAAHEPDGPSTPTHV
jgi:tetratricopeptide (TPR) repeat protein